MENAIFTKALRKDFGGRVAVKSLSLSVGKGEIFGFLGPNGSGKTTTVRLLTGQLKPTRGVARILGIDPSKEPIKAREACGIMPEMETPPSFLSAQEYLELVARIRKIPDYKKRIDNWLEFFSLEGERGTLCKDLSRGTRQKIMFVQAFIHEPKVAFIDEPLINLDPLMQKKVREFLFGYAKRGGTVFFCTHVLEVAERLCTSYAIIENGQVISKGKVGKKKGRLEREFFSKTAQRKG